MEIYNLPCDRRLYSSLLDFTCAPCKGFLKLNFVINRLIRMEVSQIMFKKQMNDPYWLMMVKNGKVVLIWTTLVTYCTITDLSLSLSLSLPYSPSFFLSLSLILSSVTILLIRPKFAPIYEIANKQSFDIKLKRF